MKLISPNAFGAESRNIGNFTTIEDRVEMFGVTVGNNCLIEEGVKIGKGTVIRSNVELRKGTVIGENCYIDSGVKTSGNCTIGNNVTLRFNAIICRGATVEDGAFVAPNVMTNYSTGNGDKTPGTIIGKDSFIGTGSVLSPGVKIGEKAIVDCLYYVREDIYPNSVNRKPGKRKLRQKR